MDASAPASRPRRSCRSRVYKRFTPDPDSPNESEPSSDIESKEFDQNSRKLRKYNPPAKDKKSGIVFSDNENSNPNSQPYRSCHLRVCKRFTPDVDNENETESMDTKSNDIDQNVSGKQKASGKNKKIDGEFSDSEYSDLDVNGDCAYGTNSVSDDTDFSVNEYNDEDASSDCDYLAPASRRLLQRGRKKRTKDRPAAEVPWQWETTSFKPTVLTFDASRSGIPPESGIGEIASESDLFLALFGPELVREIIKRSNNYHSHITRGNELAKGSALRNCKPIEEGEFYAFLCVNILMVHQRKHITEDYWRTDPLIQTPIFKKIMSRERFHYIHSHLHFCIDAIPEEEDKLAEVRLVYDYIREKIKCHLVPFQNLVINDTLVQFKGKLSFKMYLPTSRHRWGIKVFLLNDCHTGYVLDLMVFTGKNDWSFQVDETFGASGSVVKEMVENYTFKGHHLFMDTWYSSPALFKYLLDHQIGACGLVRSMRKQMPKFSKDMTRGEVVSYHCHNVMAMKWFDKHEVSLLTTIHDDTLIAMDEVDPVTDKKKMEPHALIDYNLKMKCVDKDDMQLPAFEPIRKSRHWHFKFFFYLVDLAVWNAFTLFQLKKGRHMSLKDFRLELVRQLLDKYSVLQQLPERDHSKTVAVSHLRLTGRHFPRYIPSSETKGENKHRRTYRYCYLCSHTTKRPKVKKPVPYMCIDCNKYLCIDPCFKEFHTMLHL